MFLRVMKGIVDSCFAVTYNSHIVIGKRKVKL